MGAAAQSLTSTNGTANAIPKYTDATTPTQSAITEINGNVGIGVISLNGPTLFAGNRRQRNLGELLEACHLRFTIRHRKPSG